MSYQPGDLEHLNGYYGSETDYIGALNVLLAQELDLNFKLDSLISLVSYVIWLCSLAANCTEYVEF